MFNLYIILFFFNCFTTSNRTVCLYTVCSMLCQMNNYESGKKKKCLLAVVVVVMYLEYQPIFE